MGLESIIRIFLCLLSLGLVDVSIEDTKEVQEYDAYIPIYALRQSLTGIQNLALLVTYANNVFGPSVKMKTKKISRTITDPVYMKGYALRTPDSTKIKFDSVPSNRTFYQRMIKADHSLQEQRKKRGVFHLYNMVSCATGCDPLAYVGYGCYCGFLGSGYAVDGIDRCCEIHDWCYKQASCPILEYVVPYFWKCYYNRPLCAVDHAEFGGPGSCSSKLCECDRVLSDCLSRYPCPSSKTFCRSSPFRLLHNALLIFP